MILNKFGKIYEDEHGRIKCEGFTIDCEGRVPSDAEFIAEIAVRLRRERLMPDLLDFAEAQASKLRMKS